MKEQEIVREAMSILGSRKTERKAEAARSNQKQAASARRGKLASEETRAKLREAQRLRREREHAEALARGEIVEVVKPARKKKQPGTDAAENTTGA